VPLDRIWVNPIKLVRRIFTHTTPVSRVASDHFPVVAEIDTSFGQPA
jgi:endonuclease/exonuclease/phosphatase family metal-dependent hydrolase